MEFTTDTLDRGFVAKNHFVVVHPLDDAPEEKVDLSKLGPMKMTPGVRLALTCLRGYLLIMVGMVAYHFIDMAGIIDHFKG